ncbi:MAG: Gar1/Naf1 family protein [Thaumarchaeota archaeon]|nr:Gar1/Naf1 family protein [Nitrososphaerota archaeon]
MGPKIARRPIGTAIHVAKSGRLVIKAKADIRAGEVVFDERGNKVGKVLEVIGPTRSPYLTVIPANEESKRVIGRLVYS